MEKQDKLQITIHTLSAILEHKQETNPADIKTISCLQVALQAVAMLEEEEVEQITFAY
jgi:hypothetical protein